MEQVKHQVVEGVEVKRCGSCKEWLDLKLFNKSKDTADGLYNHCIKCCAIKRRERRLKNLEYQRKKDKEYTSKRRSSNLEGIREYDRSRRLTWTEGQYQKARDWYNNWRQTNLTARLNANVMEMVRKRVKSPALGSRTFEEVFGYSREEFVLRLEDTFKEGMSWENYGFGKGKWAIDHIRPSASFSFTSYEDPEFKVCWALDNLQALWNEENMSKNSVYNGVRHFYSDASKQAYEQHKRMEHLADGLRSF